MAESFAVFDAPNAVGTQATSINNGGEVAGNLADASGKRTRFSAASGREHHRFRYSPTASGTAVFFSGVKINNPGDVTGDCRESGQIHCFVRLPANGNVTAFDIPNGPLQYAQGINDGGEIAGYFQDASQGGTTRGFLRDKIGSIIVFDAPNATFTTATSINNQGEIAGQFADSSQFSNDHGFVRHHNGNFTAFDVPNALNLFVTSINDGGDVVGGFQDTRQGGKTRGFLWDKTGNIVGFFDAPNTVGRRWGRDAGYSINNGGKVAGYFQDASQGNKGRGFVRDPNGAVTVFDGPNASTVVGQGTWTTGINDDGDIVGSFQDTSQGKTRGFVRSR